MPNYGRRGFEYGWVIVATGTLTIFASLGLARFALGMILPSMGAALGLTYAQLGYVGTANFVGYLAAVVVARPLAGRLGFRLLIAAALTLSGLAMLLVSRSASYATIVALYCAAGFGSGASNVPMMALVARWFEPARRGRAAGFVTIGSGFAIVACGALVPRINRLVGRDGWRVNWAILGLAVVAVAAVALLLLRDAPPGAASRPGAPTRAGGGPGAPVARRGAVWVLGGLYAIFGYTYAIYVTFIVTMLVREKGIAEATAGRFWSAVGLLSLLSGPVFGTLSDRIGRRGGLAVVFGVQALAYALAGADLPSAFLYLSIGCFGVAAWSIPTIMIAAVSDQVGPDRALGAFGLITFCFGVGQVAGPAVAGVLAERTGSFSSSFSMAAALAAAAVLVSGLLRGPARAPASAEGAAASYPAPGSGG